MPQTSAMDEETKHREVNDQKRSRKEKKKRKKKRSLSDSEALSDIVSRTVEECERQVKSSSVSVESLSSLSSFSCSSSDTESRSCQSESLSSSLDLAPKERALALGQLAQKLTSRVTEETSNLTHRDKQTQDVTNTPCKATSTSNEKQGIRKVPAKNLDIRSDPRASLSLSQIEKMSVEELIAKMTAMLPTKSVNEGRSNVSQADLQGINRNALENQNLECNTQYETKSENVTDDYIQDIPVKESVQGTLTEQLPKLVVPDVPKLKLSGGERKVKDPHNIVQHGQSHMLYSASNRYLNISRRKYEHAAITIQAAYRGYRVRKITNSLVTRHNSRRVTDASEIRSARGVPSRAQASVGPRSYKFFKSNDTIIAGNSERRQELPSKEGREQVNWKEIRSELESRTLKPHKESYYISQRSNLPGWIQPYFVLTETGDINNFLETQADKPDSGAVEGAGNVSSSSMINREGSGGGGGSTQNQPHYASGKAIHDVTLTEGPLSDLDKETILCYNKETQTSYNKYLNIENKENFELKNNATQEISEGEFIDFKKLSKTKVMTSPNRESIINNHEGGGLDATQSGVSHTDLEDTLEEGLLEEPVEGECSFQGSRNETLESGSIEPHLTTDEGPLRETSGTMDSSNSNTSVLVEEVSAPHELLGEGVHIGPSSLRLRLNAELMYQDTLGKALNQLHNVEQLNILNRSRQEAMALSQSLALHQQKVEFTAQWKDGDEMRTQEEEAKQRDYERRLKEKLKQQDEALQKVEKIEKEARSRFAELEREVRLRAEQVIAQATERGPQVNSTQSDVIAAAAVAAVGATISQWKQLRPVQDHDSSGSVTMTEGPVSHKSVSSQSNLFSSRSLSDNSHPGTHSVTSSSRKKPSTVHKTSSSVSEKLDESLLKSSVIEELPASKSSVQEEITSHRKNTNQDSTPESITSFEGSVAVIDENRSVSTSTIKSIGNGSTQSHNDSTPLSDRKHSSKGNEYVSSISEKMDSVSGTQTNVSSSEVKSASNLVPEDISYSKTSGTVSEAISKNDVSSGTRNSEADVSNGKSHSPTHKSFSTKDHKKHHMKEPVHSKKIHGSPGMSSPSKSKEKERKKEERDTSDIYSESFEVDSEIEDSNTSSSQFPRSQGAYGGDLALVVSSSSILNDMGYRTSAHGVGGVSAPMHAGGEGALGVTLSVVESLLKEEEVHYQHQKALLKLQVRTSNTTLLLSSRKF